MTAIQVYNNVPGTKLWNNWTMMKQFESLRGCLSSEEQAQHCWDHISLL